jgi:2-furoyl-CoA dehydrogenase large subunit
VQDALRAAGLPAVVHDSFNPPERVWRMIQDPGESAQRVEVIER